MMWLLCSGGCVWSGDFLLCGRWTPELPRCHRADGQIWHELPLWGSIWLAEICFDRQLNHLCLPNYGDWMGHEWRGERIGLRWHLHYRQIRCFLSRCLSKADLWFSRWDSVDLPAYVPVNIRVMCCYANLGNDNLHDSKYLETAAEMMQQDQEGNLSSLQKVTDLSYHTMLHKLLDNQKGSEWVL